jgi:DNA-binding transcriptional LysR family regulator
MSEGEPRPQARLVGGLVGSMRKPTARPGLKDWNDLRYFLALAESGSQAAAAKALKTNQSTVCRRLRDLEEAFDTSLFDRHYRGMRLTPAGMQLMERARQMDAAAQAIDRHIAGFDRAMQGTVRISATDGIGSFWLAPRLVEFQREFPSIMVELVTSNAAADLGRREADIAIRLFESREAKIVTKRVGTMRFAMYSAQSYLSTFGGPTQWAELARHRMVDRSSYDRLRAWRELLDGHTGVVFRTDSATAYYHAVRDGMGIGLFPTYNRIITPELVQLSIAIEASVPIWLVSHEDTNRNARVRTVLDYLYRAFERDRRDWFADR